jgi:hypothetical protein
MDLASLPHVDERSPAGGPADLPLPGESPGLPGGVAAPPTVSGARGWPLSLGLQLVEIEALARVDRRRARRWTLLAAGLLAAAVVLMVLGRAAAGATPSSGAPAMLAAAVALAAGAAAGGALGSQRSARRRDADAFTRQLRGGAGQSPPAWGPGGMGHGRFTGDPLSAGAPGVHGPIGAAQEAGHRRAEEAPTGAPTATTLSAART